MIALALKELRTNARVWLGLLATAAATALALALPTALIATGATAGGIQALALDAVAGGIAALALIAAGIVLGSVTGLAVALQRRGFALWQVLGFPPRFVVGTLVVELAVTGALGGIAGSLLAAALVRPLLAFGLQGLQGIGPLEPVFRIEHAAIVVGLVLVVVVWAGWPAARRAARVPAVAVLRDSGSGDRFRVVPRTLVAGGCAALVASMAGSLHSATLSGIGSQVVLIGPLLVAATAAIAPFIVRPVLSAWTAPGVSFLSWQLARRQLQHARTRTASTVSAVLTAAGTLGSILAGQAVVSAATGTRQGDAAAAGLLLLGGPVLLALVGGAASVFMAGVLRDREGALLAAVGGRPRLVIIASLTEAAMLVITGLLLAVAVQIVASVLIAWGLSGTAAPGAAPRFVIGPTAVVGAIAFAVITVAAVVPAAMGRRRPVRELLAAE